MAGTVDEVKQRVDIVGVIGSRLELKPAGKYVKGLCPFHGEKSPSFFVSSELQIFKCFGCGRSGDVFTFLQEYEGLSFREVLEDLADKVGVELEQYQPTAKEETTDRLRALLDLAKDYYHYLLLKHQVGEKGRSYLKERGTDATLAKAFSLGWSPEAWRGLLSYLVQKKGFSFEEVVQAGLAIESQKSGSNNYYDRFRGRIMFPLTDFRGRVVGFSGRILDKEAKEAKYINTPETTLYHKRDLLFGIDQARSIIRKQDRVIVVEGEFDVISSVGAGVHNIVAIKGSALTEEQVKLLLRLTRNITLCLDVDSAGEAATKRGIETADKLGAEISVLRVSGGKDPDDIARQSPATWKKMVSEETISVYQFYIETAFGNHDESTAAGKKHISQELVPILLGINNKVEQAYYIKEVSKRLSIGEDVIAMEMDRIQRSQRLGYTNPRERTSQDEEQSEPTKGTQVEQLEMYVWSRVLRLDGTELLQAWKEISDLDWVHPGIARLAEVLKERDLSNFKVSVFAESLPVELKALLEQLYLHEQSVAEEKPGEIVADVVQVTKRLQTLQLKTKMKLLSEEIASLEDQEDDLSDEDQAKLETMQRDFSELTKRL